MKNLKLSLLISLSYAFVGLGLLVIAYFAFTRMSYINDQSTVISQQWLPSVATVEHINTLTADVRAQEAMHILSTNSADQREVEKKLDVLMQETRENIERSRALIENENLKRLSDEFLRKYEDYLSINERIIELSRQNRNEEARALLIGDSLKAYSEYSNVLLEMAALISEKANEASDYGDTVYSDSLTTLSAITIAIIILLVVIGVYITRTMSRQIAVLQDAMSQLSQGDLTIELKDLSDNEIGTLSRHFNTTVKAFSKTITEIQDSSNQLASTSEELSTVTEQSTRGIHRQTEELEQAVSAVTELTAAVEDVARNAVATSGDSEKASERAIAGRGQVEQTIATVNALLTKLASTMTGVNNLAGQVKNIGSVLDVIRAIADQTNLLALNAAIEAARAGESGRGFAVVADEVRALAHRTQQATKEIETMIQSVQNETNTTVSAMQQSHEQAKQSVDIANEAGEALQEITDAVSRISDQNVTIASSAEEQASVAKEVDRNLVNISDIASDNASGANETSAASVELARLAENLNGLTQRFRV